MRGYWPKGLSHHPNKQARECRQVRSYVTFWTNIFKLLTGGGCSRSLHFPLLILSTITWHNSVKKDIKISTLIVAKFLAKIQGMLFIIEAHFIKETYSYYFFPCKCFVHADYWSLDYLQWFKANMFDLFWKKPIFELKILHLLPRIFCGRVCPSLLVIGKNIRIHITVKAA